MAKVTPMWQALTDEQKKRIAAASVMLKSNSTNGLYTATRLHDDKAATGRSPRQAIEALDKI